MSSRKKDTARPDIALRLALLFIAAALLGLASSSAHALCAPTLQCCTGADNSGSPACGGDGVASLGNDSGTELGAGNPINLLNGNKFQREVDMAPLPGVLGLELVRYYNSAEPRVGWLGRGWRLSYESELRLRGDEVEIAQPDGTRLRFSRSPQDPDTWLPRSPLQGRVRAEHQRDGTDGTDGTWTWADGRKLRFTQGHLASIRLPSGEVARIDYDDKGRLEQVTDPAGRRLQLHYVDPARARYHFNGVQAIDTPLGRFDYEQGSPLPEGSSASPRKLLANLVSVRYPTHPAPTHGAPKDNEAKRNGLAPYEGPNAEKPSDKLLADYEASKPDEPGISRRYHYEDPRWPTLLTGISLERIDSKGERHSTRLNTWTYDAQRRAMLSVRGERPAQGPAQDNRTKEGAQHGSAEAGPEQVSLQWLPPRQGVGQILLTNGLGQQTTYSHTLIAGQPRLLEVRGPGCATCSAGNMRYGYDPQGRLSEQTTLDASGRPLQTRRTELDRWGRPVKLGTFTWRDGKPQSPQWQVRYEYASFDERTELPSMRPVLIARPSVVVGQEYRLYFSYNTRGQPTEVTETGFSPIDEQHRPAPQGQPIRRSTTYSYSEIKGRSLLVSIDGPLPNGPKADPNDSDITRIEWDARGEHIVAVQRPGGRRIALTLDAAGRWEAALLSDGVHRLRVEPTYEALISAVASPASVSQSVWFVDEAGVERPGSRTSQQHQVQPDLAAALTALPPDGTRDGGEPVQALRTASRPQGAELAGPVAATEQDAFGRPVAWFDRGGVKRLRLGWGEPGSVAQATLLSLSTTSAQAQRQVDDWGRVVAIKNPGQGWQTARYDTVDRIIEVHDPRGAHQVAQWDVAGRLRQLQRYAPNASEPEQTSSWTYAGPWADEETLVDADGVRSLHTERNGRGQVLRQSLLLRPAGALLATLKRVEMSVAYSYDEQGRLLRRSFTDGQGRTVQVQQTLNAQGQPEALSTEGWLPRWLGGGEQRFVQQVRWQSLSPLQSSSSQTSLYWATEIEHSDRTTDRYGPVTPRMPSEAEARPVEAARPAETAARTTEAAHLSATGMSDRTTSWALPGRGADAAGLPAEIDTDQGLQHLHWNAAAQLQQTDRADGSRSRYLYDARGRRVVKLVTDTRHTSATLSFYEDSRLLAEADAEGRATHAYAYIGWRPVAQLLLDATGWQALKARLFGPEVRALHTDRAGQVLRMTEQGHNVWQQPTREGLIRIAAPGLGAHQPLRYVGQYHDDDSGLDYHGARYYESGIGRFISPDPQGVADAVNAVAPNALLDPYAYAGGQPEDFFDPDGAARIRYFAITTGADGKALGNPVQGFTRARWAFIVDDVRAPLIRSGDAVLDDLQRRYASDGTGLLYDANGNFLPAEQSAATWSGANSGTAGSFMQHYGDNLISISQFTVEMSDADATKLIASYITADSEQLYPDNCPVRSLLLPPIKFALEEPPIVVTSSKSGDADKQRILPCGVGSDKDVDERRVAKYEAAAEINETGRINRDCSKDGCPGIGYYCDSTKCYTPRDQLSYGPPKTNQPVYTPSFGRSQFIGSTLVGHLLSAYRTFPADDLNQLGLTAAIQSMLETAQERGDKMAKWWKTSSGLTDYASANSAWSDLSAADRARFTAETGLGERAYTDMIRIKTQPPKNSLGKDLSADAREALVTAAIMSNSAARDYLMGIFKDFDKFTIMGRALMKENLANAKRYQPGATEAHFAAMVARAHNGGTWMQTYKQLVSSDAHDYVKNFVGTAGYRLKGDWNALRCAEGLGPDTVTQRTNGKGIGGLEMAPLVIK